MFFFEKKNQKTFVRLLPRLGASGQKSFASFPKDYR
jgi:hypothetical protein